MPEQLLSVETALSILQMGRTTFYANVNQGLIKAKKVGRRTFVEYREIQRFVAALPNYPTKLTRE